MHKISYFGIFVNATYADFMSSIHSKEYESLIDRLIKARKDAGLTQVQVSELLKKHQSYISKIETCQRRIDVLEVKALAKVYGADIAKII